jgi:predicted Rossmann fold nucleotide-binding protein DprA/Smf involved in DNA uptake
MALELAMSESGPYLQLTSAANAVALAQGDPLLEQILALLSRSSEPCTAESLRSRLQVRNQRLLEALRQLCEQGKAVRLPQGYVRPHNSALPLMIESSSPRVAPR